MRIVLDNIAKRFSDQWIFRSVNLEFEKGKSYAILGANGSGKSTLLQVISGFIVPSKGDVSFIKDKTIPKEKMYREIACAAPYMEVYEDLNLEEALSFQVKFKPLVKTENEILEELDLPINKKIADFSSGMKQKVKLALALFADVPVLLLDEPTSNLDAKAKEWYSKKVSEIKKDRLILVCSNYQELEYSFTDEQIKMEDLKSEIKTVV
ncbi:MAG: ABC transporter ATP-binding protein [Flavobacteriales bacterium]|nr:ABC transporter ATP-binding protein [Flavobacteriales bacterium]